MPLLKFSKYLKETDGKGNAKNDRKVQQNPQANTPSKNPGPERKGPYETSFGSDLASIRTSELDTELANECQQFVQSGEVDHCLQDDFGLQSPNVNEAKEHYSTGFDSLNNDTQYGGVKTEADDTWDTDASWKNTTNVAYSTPIKDTRSPTPVQRRLFDEEGFDNTDYETPNKQGRRTPIREVKQSYASHQRGGSPSRDVTGRQSPSPAKHVDTAFSTPAEHMKQPYTSPQRVGSPSPDTRPRTPIEKCCRQQDVPGTCNRQNKCACCERPITPTDGAKIRSGAIIMLDEQNRFRPITHSGEVTDLIRQLQKEEPQMLDATLTEKLARLSSVDFNTCLHYANTGNFLQELQESNQITDVTIAIGKTIFHAHRIALACYSDYFKDLFCNGGIQKRVPISVRLRGIHPESFKMFLKYVYTGELSVTPELAGDLIIMSEKLKIPPLKERCIEFMDNLPLDQAVALVKSGAVSSSTELYDCAMSCIANKFSELYKMQIYLSLDLATVCTILSYDHLIIQSEFEVFRAGLKWIGQNQSERHQHLSRVMACVRFAYMTHMELFRCTEITDLLAENAFCRDLLLKANWTITARMIGKRDNLAIQLRRPRNTYAAAMIKQSDIFYSAHSFDGVNVQVEEMMENPEIAQQELGFHPRGNSILALGQFYNAADSNELTEAKLVAGYDTSSNKWKTFTELPEPRIHHATASLGDNIYVVGGSDPRKVFKSLPVPTNQALMFDTRSNQWREIAPMKTPRIFHSLCALYGMLYAIGGQDENNRVLSSVECYNPRTNNWFYVTPMSVARIGCGSSAMDGLLYVVGGYSDTVEKTSGGPVLCSVECFNPKFNKWQTVRDLRFPRCHANLVTVDNRLYICGGATRTHTSKESVISSVSAVDRYDAVEDVWEHVTDLVISRHSAGATVVGSKIFVLGGICSTANRVLQSMEVYDVKRDIWMTDIAELPFPAKWLSCIAIPCGV